jgi:hypothetical protein
MCCADLNYAEDVDRVEAVQRRHLDPDLVDVVVLGMASNATRSALPIFGWSPCTPEREVLPHPVGGGLGMGSSEADRATSAGRILDE